MIASIIIFILVLSFLVIIHELGHFLVATWAKIKVEEFGLGYPPRALKLFTFKNTLFSLNWIPFGGFVKMEGEDASLEDVPKAASQKNVTGPFYEKTAFQRLAVLLAGATVNFVFGVLAFGIVYSFVGIPTPIQEARIGYIAPNSPAQQAGVPTNVNLIALRQDEAVLPISNVEDAVEAINQRRGETVTIVTTGTCDGQTCQEMAQEFEVYLRTESEIADPAQEGSLGVAFQSEELRFYPWYEMPVRGMVVGITQAVMLTGLILQALSTMVGDLFTRGQVPADVMGPVGIVHQASESGLLLEGPIAVLHFAGLLSINLAIMNVLPIPALDGGRALFVLLEKIVGRRRLIKWEGYAHYGGFILLLGLIILITGRDIWRIIAG